ncbi:MAG: carbohydrate kinase family protein [Anaerolineales bacterium]
MLDVLLPSMYFCDLVFTGLPEMPRLGNEIYCKNLKVIPGGGFIPAVALNRLGLQVGWACDFGNDFFSRFALEQVRQQNLSERLFRMHDIPLQSVTVSYSFSHERAFLTYLDSLPPFDLPALIRENPARCLMLMGLSSGPDFHKTVAAAREVGALVFMECQATDASLDAPQVEAALKAVDIFAPNQEEALRLTGEKTVETALERLAELTPTVVIKLGADGAIARRQGEQARLPGLSVLVEDTTGAGDNFDCGFVYGVLQGYSLEDSLRCGNYCGGLSTTACGGWEASPAVEQLEDWLAGQRNNN